VNYLYVTEILKSLQGESTYQGIPCIFVRLSGCNLRCDYCDTKYSYETGHKKSINEIVSEVDSLKLPIVEITGGEPLLQKNTTVLMERLLKKEKKVLLETNGSLSIEKVPAEVVKIMDIKTPSSGMADKINIKNLDFLNKNDEIKFVLCNKNDYEWAKNFIFKYDLHEKCKILFSGVFKVFSYSELADLIVKDNLPVRLNLQLHKIIWGENSKK